ncbi:hypothetical protein ACIQF6_14935 [Kitasatospora sp. NPDC092948]|uniref:hypothetical protein n=1 Tax=Kitasatospora sp. NPDC092948 TaxID=3364088 RepID=UPI0037F82F25
MTGPLATIAALHALMDAHPELAATPSRWQVDPDGTLHADPPFGADGGHRAVQALAAALGFGTTTYDTTLKDGRTCRVVLIDHTAALAEMPVYASAWEPVVPLPVREVHTDAEQQLCASWIDQHGDPADWSLDTRLAYSAAVALARAEGAL